MNSNDSGKNDDSDSNYLYSHIVITHVCRVKESRM